MVEFVKKQLLALPTISLRSMKPGDTRYFRAVEPIKVAVKEDKSGNPVVDPESGNAQEIATLHVIDLESGEEGEIVLGFIVRQALERVENLIDFTFGMTKGVTKNRTTEWQVFEVEVK